MTTMGGSFAPLARWRPTHAVSSLELRCVWRSTWAFRCILIRRWGFWGSRSAWHFPRWLHWRRWCGRRGEVARPPTPHRQRISGPRKYRRPKPAVGSYIERHLSRGSLFRMKIRWAIGLNFSLLWSLSIANNRWQTKNGLQVNFFHFFSERAEETT